MHILIVEDDRVTKEILHEYLGLFDYTLSLAEDGEEAWRKINRQDVDIVVADWRMPNMSGSELCNKIREAHLPDYTYFIMISGLKAPEDVLKGLEEGADDYVTKPIDLKILHARIKTGERIVRLKKELKNRYINIKNNYFQTIRMFTNLIEVYFEELGGHCRRVGQICFQLAQKHPDVNEKEYSIVEAAGELHDIGMVGLPKDLLLKKRTELNQDEKKLYMAHPIQGEMILKEISFLKSISEIIRSHHEQYNGLGFPDRLKGEEIPLLSRIVSAASIYDSLLNKYKISMKDIHYNLQQQKGYELDPVLVDCLLELNLSNIQAEEGKTYFEISLEELHSGMTLKADIRMKSGALVMPAMTQLTIHSIEKLKNYFDLDCITDKVFVYKESMRD